jgi:hypothetical protein
MEILTARDDYGAYWLEVLQEGAQIVKSMPITPLHVKGILGILS